jgi:phenylalanyl-tRNA synthetase alpha chain
MTTTMRIVMIRHHGAALAFRNDAFCSSWKCFSSQSHSTSSLLSERFDLSAPDCNVTENIQTFIGRNIHQRPLHPLNTIHRKICDYWNNNADNTNTFHVYDNISPVVSTTDCFDMLRIPADHVSRSVSDTYYLNRETVLRPHTSAHQVELLKTAGHNRFLVTGDVYRRDEIDRSHYPVFHQMEGVKMFTEQQLQDLSEDDQIALIEQDLKQGLEGLATHLFGPVQMRWADEYFPFTHPSFELEIFFDNEWMEVLGCGVIHPDILTNAGRAGEKGWAFGLGLERLAMVLFQIPDIRLFWTEDERFHKQFASGEIVAFQPYSKYPPCFKDISFWIREDFHVNDLNEVVRDVAGDLVEQVELIDNFTHAKTGRTSHCYRISYRSMDRSLTNEEIDALQEEVRVKIVEQMGVELR